MHVEVIGSALASIAEEMGETLVSPPTRPTSRSAATAPPRIFDARGRDPRPGRAHPDPPRLADGHRRGGSSPLPARGHRARATPSSATTRTPAAAPTCPTSSWSTPVFLDGDAGRLGDQPRPPRRLRRPRPRAHLPGGPAHPAGAALRRAGARNGHARADPAQLPGAARAHRRPPRPDGGQPPRRPPRCGSSATRYGAPPSPRRARRCSTTPSARPAPGSPRSPTASTASRTASTATSIDRRDRRSGSTIEVTRRRDAPRLRGAAAGARQPQHGAGPRCWRRSTTRSRRWSTRTIPANAGLYRPINVTAPPGSSSTAARRPRSTAAPTCQRVVDLIHGALAQAVPDRVIAAVQRGVTGVHVLRDRPAHRPVLRLPGDDRRRLRRGGTRTASTACRCTSPTPATCRSSAWSRSTRSPSSATS